MENSNVLETVIETELTGVDPGAIDGNGKTFSQEERSFSQEDVNKIINDRLKKEKDKSERQLEVMAKEYAQKELHHKAKELLTSKGLSSDILEVLKFDDETTLTKNIDILEKAFKAIPPAKRVIAGARPAETLSPGGNNTGDLRAAMGLNKK